jgi:hypothetical protein
MKTITKTLVGTVAAGAMALTAAAPAAAQDWRRDRDRGGIDVGDVIAGAVILGGIAAVAGAIGGDRDGYDGRYYNGRDYNDRYNDRYYNKGNPEQAIELCVRTAEREAQRRGFRADVVDIRDIDRNNRGYTVKGRIAVNQYGRTWRHGQPNYGGGWNNDYRGWNQSMRGYDSGNFTCKTEYNRVRHLDYSGIRGL